MNAAIATTIAPARPTAARAQAFFQWLYDTEAGYIEIVAGTTNPANPSKIKLQMDTRRFLYCDPERPDLLEQAGRYAEQLADTYNNVYCGVRLYDKRAKLENTRKEEYTRPSRVIFIDDAPAAPSLPYSASIRTSEHSRHAYYKCDRNVTKDDARRAAAALGGDPSGVDITQLVRIPGTHNTKHGRAWPVASEPSSRTIYTVEQIRAAFPEVAPARSKANGEICDLAWPEVEQHLANLDQLLVSGRAKTIKPETQTGRILAGEMLTFVVRHGNDDSRSMNGYVLGNGFYMRGFMDDEIAAVMFDRYRKWGVERDKGTFWCKDDISRSIARMHAEKPGVYQTPTRYKQTAAAAAIIATPAPSRARLDRPTRYDAPMLLARYHQQPEICELKRKERAARLEISTATLDRLEDVLEAQDLIQIEAPRGMPGRVILRGVINIPRPEVLSGQNAESTAHSVAIAETADRAPQYIGGTHAPPEGERLPLAPPEVVHAPFRLADVVRAAFDLAMVDQGTGERKKITRRRVMIALGPITRSDAAIDRAIADERVRRRIAAIIADIRSMAPATLRAQIRLLERLADKSREHGTNLHKFADWAAGEMRTELASRPAETRKPRKNCEVLPDLRAAGERYQTELLDLVDQARIGPAPTTQGRIARGVCSPQPPAPAGEPTTTTPPAGGHASEGTYQSLMASIRNLRAGSEARP